MRQCFLIVTGMLAMLRLDCSGGDGGGVVQTACVTLWPWFVCIFQEERQRTKGDKGDGDTESSCGAISDMPIASIREAELGVDPIDEQPLDQGVRPPNLCQVPLAGPETIDISEKCSFTLPFHPVSEVTNVYPLVRWLTCKFINICAFIFCQDLK